MGSGIGKLSVENALAEYKASADAQEGLTEVSGCGNLNLGKWLQKYV